MWTKIKTWLKKNWLFVLNPLVIFIVYSMIYEKGFDVAEALMGLTILANVGFWVYKTWGPKPKNAQ